MVPSIRSKAFAVLLSMTMVFTMMPGITMTARAAAGGTGSLLYRRRCG